MLRLATVSKCNALLKSRLGLTPFSTSSLANTFAKNTVQSKDGKVTFSNGLFGHLSETSVLCNVGGSVVHAAVNSTRASDPSEAFLPLTVDYRARQYAIGVIPGSRQRREAHNTQDEVLVGRFIDRAVRPLFPKGYVNEVQLTVTNHAADGVHDPTVAAVNAASLALMLSKQPWQGPLGCVRVGLVDGQLVVDPSVKEMEASTLDFLYAGTADRALMIETLADQVPEETIKQAMRMAQEAVQDLIQTQQLFVDKFAAKTETTGVETTAAAADGGSVPVEVSSKRSPFLVPPELKEAVRGKIFDQAVAVYSAGADSKADRGRAEGALRGDALAALAQDSVWGAEHIVTRKMAVETVLTEAFRSILLRGGNRIDGRGLSELRQVGCSAPAMPSVHGSSYFARGDTHVLTSVTLGSKTDALEVLPINGSSSEAVPSHFMLHYDFPPYCTGETGNATALNRRMVGHGKLAEKALLRVMPPLEEFPYAVRVYSECTSSNGSSSMASACGASLALMDAGVPIKSPVAGLSVGLVTHPNLRDLLRSGAAEANTPLPDGQRPYALVKDILGTEDHNGDMDFKIAGSAQGVTAIQLDVKLEGGVPLFMLEGALDLAAEGRREILATMRKTLARPNLEVKPNSPKAVLVKYDEERRSQLTGPGGEMVKYLQELYECEIDTTVPGVAYIFGKDAKAVADAQALVQDIAVMVKEGDTIRAQVLEVKDFGLTVKLNRAQEALLHVSDISHDRELLKTPLGELFKEGQRFNVKVYSADKATGIIKVSRKMLLDEASSVPDRLHLTVAGSNPATAYESLPEFPVQPPRKYSRDYFAHSVTTDAENKAAVELHARTVNRVAPAPRNTAPANRAVSSSNNASAQSNYRPATSSSGGYSGGRQTTGSYGGSNGGSNGNGSNGNGSNGNGSNGNGSSKAGGQLKESFASVMRELSPKRPETPANSNSSTTSPEKKAGDFDYMPARSYNSKRPLPAGLNGGQNSASANNSNNNGFNRDGNRPQSGANDRSQGKQIASSYSRLNSNSNGSSGQANRVHQTGNRGSNEARPNTAPVSASAASPRPDAKRSLDRPSNSTAEKGGDLMSSVLNELIDGIKADSRKVNGEGRAQPEPVAAAVPSAPAGASAEHKSEQREVRKSDVSAAEPKSEASSVPIPDASASPVASEGEPAKVKKPRAPRNRAVEAAAVATVESETSSAETLSQEGNAAAPAQPKKRAARKKKAAVEEASQDAGVSTATDDAESAAPVKKTRTRKTKGAEVTIVDGEAVTAEKKPRKPRAKKAAVATEEAAAPE